MTESANGKNLRGTTVATIELQFAQLAMNPIREFSFWSRGEPYNLKQLEGRNRWSGVSLAR